MIKTVFDTNILISGFLWGGYPNLLLRSAKEGRVSLQLSMDIVQEFEDVLTRDKFQKRLAALGTGIDDIVNDLAGFAEISDVITDLKVVVNDEDDDKFIACAIATQSKYLVSGDNHLIDLKKFRSVSIVTPLEFYMACIRKAKKK